MCIENDSYYYMSGFEGTLKSFGYIGKKLHLLGYIFLDEIVITPQNKKTILLYNNDQLLFNL